MRSVSLFPSLPFAIYTLILCINTHVEKALSEAHKSLDDIRSEMLAWQAQYSDIHKELKEVKGTSDTLRVK